MTSPIHPEIERMIRAMFDAEGREVFTHDRVELVAAVRHLLAELDHLRGRLAMLGEPELQHRLIGVSGEAHTPTERDLAHPDQWLPGVLHEVRDVYPTPWRAADAQPSTPKEDS